MIKINKIYTYCIDIGTFKPCIKHGFVKTVNFEGKKQTKYFFVQNLYLVINIKIFKYSKS
jgi:hypothetical protein